MLDIKEFDLIRYQKDEIVFSNRNDLINAIQELSNGNDIVVSYSKQDRLRSIILTCDIITKFRNGEVSIIAEKKLNQEEEI